MILDYLQNIYLLINDANCSHKPNEPFHIQYEYGMTASFQLKPGKIGTSNEYINHSSITTM